MSRQDTINFKVELEEEFFGELVRISKLPIPEEHRMSVIDALMGEHVDSQSERVLEKWQTACHIRYFSDEMKGVMDRLNEEEKAFYLQFLEKVKVKLTPVWDFEPHPYPDLIKHADKFRELDQEIGGFLGWDNL